MTVDLHFVLLDLGLPLFGEAPNVRFPGKGFGKISGRWGKSERNENELKVFREMPFVLFYVGYENRVHDG